MVSAVLLLPADERQQARLYDSAAAAIARVTTFCDRNPKLCAWGGELWADFLKKAEFGARMAVDLVSASGRKEEGQGGAAYHPTTEKRQSPGQPPSGRPASRSVPATSASCAWRPVWRAPF